MPLLWLRPRADRHTPLLRAAARNCSSMSTIHATTQLIFETSPACNHSSTPTAGSAPQPLWPGSDFFLQPRLDLVNVVGDPINVISFCR
uniref:Uncharacterized protein n=1 Tax=Arundo donax TaxID=35708 RepID=A0A0A9DTJ9_ARUDO